MNKFLVYSFVFVFGLVLGMSIPGFRYTRLAGENERLRLAIEGRDSLNQRLADRIAVYREEILSWAREVDSANWNAHAAQWALLNSDGITRPPTALPRPASVIPFALLEDDFDELKLKKPVVKKR